MNCPDCLTGELKLKYASTEQPGSERYWEEYWLCDTCGAKFSDEDLQRAVGSD